MRILVALLILFSTGFAYVGQDYEDFIKDNPDAKILSVDKKVIPKAQKALEIQKDGFNIYTLFDKKNICYEEYTLHNKTLPNPSIFIKDIQNAKAKLLFRIPLRMALWEYDVNGSKILYQTFGLPGDLGADARLK